MRTVLGRHPRVSGRTEFDAMSGEIERLASGFRPASRLVGVNLVGLDRMAAMNRAYKGRRGAAEVLTFDYSGEDDVSASPEDPSAEIYICWARLERTAGRLGVPAAHYALRLLAHGFCHLVGHSHRDEASADRMEEEERRRLDGLLPRDSLKRVFGPRKGVR